MSAATSSSLKNRPFTASIYVPGQDAVVHESVRLESTGHDVFAEAEDEMQIALSSFPEPKSCAVSIDSASSESNEHVVNPGNEKKGLCIKCGKQLYKIKTKKKGIFHHGKTKEVKVPLSIPGEVERGQCLQCGTSTACDAVANNVTSITVSPSLSINLEDDMGVESVPNSTPSIMPGPSKAVYEGPHNVYGERDGHGVMKWENGDVYTGDFFNGNRHGHGTLQFLDGSEYVGQWECNRQHGVGTRRWNNGDCYTGQYLNGERTGEGRFYFSNGDMYTGQWIAGSMEGFGRYYYASGQRFKGTFCDGKRKGKGKLQRTDGSLDMGVYHHDVRVGVGVRWSADRTVAWKMNDGQIKKKITIPEAVALDYDIEATARALDDDTGRVV